MISYCIDQSRLQMTTEYLILQDDLNTLTKWADHWLIEFNIPKCKIMRITTHYNKLKNFKPVSFNTRGHQPHFQYVLVIVSYHYIFLFLSAKLYYGTSY